MKNPVNFERVGIYIGIAPKFYARACARGQPTHVHAHVNGVVQCQPGKSPTIYHRNIQREKNERSVSVHTSVDCGDVW